VASKAVGLSPMALATVVANLRKSLISMLISVNSALVLRIQGGKNREKTWSNKPEFGQLNSAKFNQIQVNSTKTKMKKYDRKLT
jgi:hypothetical protein